MACGAGLLVLAAATTVGHFDIMLVFSKLVRRLPRPQRIAIELRMSYEDGRGLLRSILVACTELGFGINHVQIDRESRTTDSRENAQDLADIEGIELKRQGGISIVTLCMQIKGNGLSRT